VSPLAQLTLSRYREFIREPEAVFWVFIFPILLAAGLGLAFRSKPADVAHIAVASAPGAAPAFVEALRTDKRVEVMPLADTAAVTALRTGRIALLVRPRPDGGVDYQYDDTRPDARAAREVVDDVVQRAAGRRDPVTVGTIQVRERGARYVDFVIPGLLGMNLMGSGIWGIGFAIVDARKKKLLKRLIATPMSRAEYLLSFLLHRLVLLVFEVSTLVGFGALVFGVPIRGSHRIVVFWLARAAGGVAGADHGGCVGAHESRDAADVGPLRRVLLVVQLSVDHPAVHPGPAAHGGE
jgi:hypothetical protein